MRYLIASLTVTGLLAMATQLTLADTSKNQLAALLKELKSKDPKTRISAAEELGHIGAVRAADAKEAVPVLLELLKKEKDANVRKAFVTALGKMDPDPEKVVPSFTEALKDKSPAVRVAAAGALSMLGDEAKDAIPALKEAVNDKDRNVSRAARMALRSITNKKKP